MSADLQNGRTALAEDLDLTEDDAARVKGGMFPIEPGRGVSVRFPRIIVARKKKVAKRHYPAGGRPV
jgi:hypothetical protein